MHCCHPSFYAIQFVNQLLHFIVDSVLELAKSFGQLLDDMGKFCMDWNLGNDSSKLCHFGQCFRVSQTLQGLLKCKVEGGIFDKQIELVFIHAGDL
jgi:hypothetical protein